MIFDGFFFGKSRRFYAQKLKAREGVSVVRFM